MEQSTDLGAISPDARDGPEREPTLARLGTVLVVDDDPAALVLCRHTLRGSGYKVMTADSAAAALDRLLQEPFDVVLIDLQMPVVDGLTLLDQIRSRHLDMPIIIISAAATIDQAAQAMRLGAQAMLLKPFTPTDLRLTVADTLQRRRDMRTHDRVAALRPLVRISQRLAELDLPRLYDLIIETVRVEIDADRASLMLWDEGSQTLRIAASSGLPQDVHTGQMGETSDALAGWVAAHRQPLLIDSHREVLSSPAELRDLLARDQLLSALSVPLMAGTQVLGVLNAAKTHAGPGFTDADRDLLALLASQAAIALENARLYTTVAHSEARYRSLLHHATDAVLLLDADARQIIDGNPAASQLSGYDHAILLRTAPAQLLPQIGDWRLKGDDGLAGSPLNVGAHPAGDTGEIETVLMASSGNAVPISVSVSLVPHAGQQLLLVIARDISERRRMAQQLLQTEKLAAVGRLSASIAHEINNPLQAIHNSLHLLITRTLTDEKRERYLTMAQEEVERLISIVQRMIDFYRPSREGMRPTDLHDLLESVLTLIGQQFEASRVRVDLRLHERLPLVFAIGNHIKQVYLNLMLNAIEAMPEGGTLTIHSYVVETPDLGREAGFTSVPATGTAGHQIQGPAVVIEFSDTGQGIPPQDLGKVFEPFYTTRTKGTGLGLAVSYSIIEQHHGELSVSSTVGEGTTFRIRLPVAQ